ncbi:heavy metal transporter [Streptomyces thioluteus]|uniref:Heavy metal transporter n=1 Tax=Streptomyces thioluteus TaxID=66431 RepID=A0ABN3WUD7_STRTU
MSPIFPVRRGRLLRIGAACAVLLALIGYLVAYFVTGGPGAPRCTASADGESYSLDPEQAGNASTITAVGTSRGLPERAVTIALATAMQESGLRNIHHGDRDSLGLFQQRPTQGWGTARQITDPVYAAGAFYDHLVRVPGYSRLPLTVAAQRVQRSGFPQAYAKHEPGASLLAAALSGRAPAAFSCSTSPSDGKPGDPAAVRAGLRRDFGPSVLPATGVSGGGKSGKKGDASPRTVSVPPRPVPTTATDNGPRRRGWELASWAVAHAAELRVERVSFDGRVWTAENSRDGWRRGAGQTDEGPVAVRITTAQ